MPSLRDFHWGGVSPTWDSHPRLSTVVASQLAIVCDRPSVARLSSAETRASHGRERPSRSRRRGCRGAPPLNREAMAVDSLGCQSEVGGPKTHRESRSDDRSLKPHAVAPRLSLGWGVADLGFASQAFDGRCFATSDRPTVARLSSAETRASHGRERPSRSRRRGCRGAPPLNREAMAVDSLGCQSEVGGPKNTSGVADLGFASQAFDGRCFATSDRLRSSHSSSAVLSRDRGASQLWRFPATSPTQVASFRTAHPRSKLKNRPRPPWPASHRSPKIPYDQNQTFQRS